MLCYVYPYWQPVDHFPSWLILFLPQRNVDGRAEQLSGGGGKGRVPVHQAGDHHEALWVIIIIIIIIIINIPGALPRAQTPGTPAGALGLFPPGQFGKMFLFKEYKGSLH